MREFLTTILIITGLFWRLRTRTTIGAIALVLCVLLISATITNIFFFYPLAGDKIGYVIAFELFVFLGASIFWVMAYAGYGILSIAAFLFILCGVALLTVTVIKENVWLGYTNIVISLAFIGILLNLQVIEIKLFFSFLKQKMWQKKKLIEKWSDLENVDADVLLLTASAGSGHLVAARNIASALEEQLAGIKVKCINVFDFLGPCQREFQESAWEYLARYTPSVYRPIHRFIITSAKRLVEKEAVRVAANLERAVKGSPSVIVSTHPMAVAIGSELKKHWDSRLIVVPTDYYVHPHYTASNVDLYCLPSRECFFVGVDREAILEKSRITGIPISIPSDMPDKETARQKLGIPKGQNVIFINFGGIGILRTKIFLELLSFVIFCEEPFHFLLPSSLKELFGDVSSCSVVENPWLALAASDVMIGKVGGLSITEALSLDVSIGIWEHGGPEDFNAKFLLRAGKGARVGGFKELLFDFPWTKRWISLCAKKERHSEIGKYSATEIAKEIIFLQRQKS